MKQFLLLTGAILGFLLGFLVTSAEGWFISFAKAISLSFLGISLVYIMCLLYAAKERRKLGKNSTDDLYQCVRHSDIAGVLECLIAGAKASELRDSTFRHAIKRIRVILRFFLYIGH